MGATQSLEKGFAGLILSDNDQILPLLMHRPAEGWLGHEDDGGAAAFQGQEIKLLVAKGTGAGWLRSLVAVPEQLQELAIIDRDPPDDPGTGDDRERHGEFFQESDRLLGRGKQSWPLTRRSRLFQEFAIQDLGLGGPPRLWSGTH